MTSSLDAALSGMLAHERGMDLIANNLANVNTTGYKRAVVHFQDLLNSSQIMDALNGNVPPGGAMTSSGVIAPLLGMVRDFGDGTPRPTGRDLDFAIIGNGFFKVALDDGTMAYTRDGTFQIDAQRRIVTQSGQLLQPPMTLPENSHGMRLEVDGRITVVRPYTEAERQALPPGAPPDGVREGVGRVTLARFPNPGGLESIGHNLYRETADSQPPIAGFPGEQGMGEVVSGLLEASNVDIATEMTMLVLTARAYQLNLSAYKTIEQMLNAANQLAG